MFLIEKLGERARNTIKVTIRHYRLYWITIKLKETISSSCNLFIGARVFTMLILPQRCNRRRRPSLAANWPHIQSHLNQFTCLHLRLSLQPEACGAPEPRWAKPVRLLPAAGCYSPRRQASRCWGRRGRSKSGSGSSTQRCNWDAYSAFPWK